MFFFESFCTSSDAVSRYCWFLSCPARRSAHQIKLYDEPVAIGIATVGMKNLNTHLTFACLTPKTRQPFLVWASGMRRLHSDVFPFSPTDPLLPDRCGLTGNVVGRCRSGEAKPRAGVLELTAIVSRVRRRPKTGRRPRLSWRSLSAALKDCTSCG